MGHIRSDGPSPLANIIWLRIRLQMSYTAVSTKVIQKKKSRNVRDNAER